MSAKTWPLPDVRAPAQPIPNDPWIGNTGHRRLQSLQGNGLLPARPAAGGRGAGEVWSGAGGA